MNQSLCEKNYSYSKQTIDDEDVQAVLSVLQSDWLTQGPSVQEFEQHLAEKFGSRRVTAVCNGTAALHLMGLALGWKPGDIVITSPLTFLASANCILYAGATPDFVDIDPHTYTIDVDRLETRVKEHQAQGRTVKAVVAVDYAGHPCDWKALHQLAQRYEFQLVDDAAHSMGARYEGDSIGSSRFADCTMFSFHPVKHVTTGEGGAILTNSLEIDESVKRLRTHGVTKDESRLQRNDGPWYYEMQELGFNYRITDLQCALGVSQLKKLERFVEKRQAIAQYYDAAFESDDRMTVPQVASNVSHVYHLYPLRIHFERLSISKQDLFRKLREKRISCQVHYIPVHFQPYYQQQFGFREGDYPIAERIYRQEVSIPVYPQLESEDLDYISTTIRRVLEG